MSTVENDLTVAVSPVSATSTTGDARRLLLETAAALKVGSLKPDVGMAISAVMDSLNGNMLAEIAMAKVQLQAKAVGADFGKIVDMGKKQLG
jgi:hypothetical protein